LRSVFIYDKARSMKRAGILLSDIEITRFEAQFRGKAVPIRSFSQIDRYVDLDVIEHLEVQRVVTEFEPSAPQLFLIGQGFRLMVSKYGLDCALKLFPSSYRAFLKRKFLGGVLKSQLDSLRTRLQKGVADWLSDRIRFPRLRGRSGR
jgi:hypothetical protein